MTHHPKATLSGMIGLLFSIREASNNLSVFIAGNGGSLKNSLVIANDYFSRPRQSSHENELSNPVLTGT